MLGGVSADGGSRGLIPRAMTYLFERARAIAARRRARSGARGGGGSGGGLDMTVRVSYVEIYNERLVDLLAPPAATTSPTAAAAPTTPGGGLASSTAHLSSSLGGMAAAADAGHGGAPVSLEIREDRSRGGEIVVVGAREEVVSGEREVLDMLWRGARNRAMAATDMNEVSRNGVWRVRICSLNNEESRPRPV